MMRSQTSVGMALCPTLVEYASDSLGQMQEGIDTDDVCGGCNSCVSATVSSLDMLDKCAMSGGGDGDSRCEVGEHR